MSAVRVSVALATYNGARYLEEQLASILEQTRPVDEIVVADDGSSDETLAIVRRMLGSAGPELVLLESRPGHGVTANFARALAAASGDLIALSDQDDVWHPRRIERQVAAFAARPALLLHFSNATLVDGSNRPLGTTMFDSLGVRPGERAEIRSGLAFHALLRRNLATGATVMLRRSLLDQATPFPSEWVHDEWLAIIAGALGEVDYSDDQLVRYRQHGANQIGASDPGIRHRIARVLERRGERNRGLATRWRVFADRVATLGDPDRLATARAKAAFEARRAAMPASRLRRVPSVLRELRRGDYARFASQGTVDVIRDLLQPA